MNSAVRHIAITLALFYTNCCEAQVRYVPLVTQEQSQWCWAGCSKCMLNYYGDSISQCQIAEYARERVTWMSYGTVNCCADPDSGCNNPNYEANTNGSIQDILTHFAHIYSMEQTGPLSKSDVATNLAENKLFVEHWNWYTGGGHFVVGYGISGDTVYYMNPWPGEGITISTYSNMVNDSVHIWNYTLNLTYLQVAVPQIMPQAGGQLIYPNPSSGVVTVTGAAVGDNDVKICNQAGQLVYQTTLKNSTTNRVDLSFLPKGTYIVKIKSADADRYTKLLLE